MLRQQIKSEITTRPISNQDVDSIDSGHAKQTYKPNSLYRHIEAGFGTVSQCHGGAQVRWKEQFGLTGGRHGSHWEGRYLEAVEIKILLST